LLEDVTLRYDFIGAGRDGGLTHGKLRTPTTRTTSSRAPLPTRFAKIETPIAAIDRWLSCRHACLPRNRIHGEFLRLLFFLANKKAGDYFGALGYQPHKQEFSPSQRLLPANPVHHRMACAQAVAIHGAPTTPRIATSRHLATCRPSTWPTTSMTAMSATSMASPRSSSAARESAGILV
jgi:hypothetical protein